MSESIYATRSSRLASRASSQPPLPADHWSTVTNLPYFTYVRREEAEELIQHTENQYILRLCNDTTEWINGHPNPNVFVISYSLRAKHPQPGEKTTRLLHSKLRRVPGKGFYFGDPQPAEDEIYYPTITELLNSSSLHGLRPLEGLATRD